MAWSSKRAADCYPIKCGVNVLFEDAKRPASPSFGKSQITSSGATTLNLTIPGQDKSSNINGLY
jgi:hypothetical protein